MAKNFVCRKFFRGTSDLGLTLFWLKSTFGPQLQHAVAEAVTMLYFPACLASSIPAPNPEQVNNELLQSSRIFERWMALQRDALQKPTVTRFWANFALTFDVSKTGQCLSWLEKKPGRTLEQYIFDAVLLLYLPLALAAAGSKRLDLERLRSRTVFSQAIDLPGYPFPLGEAGEPDAEPVVKATILFSPFQSSSVESQRPDLSLGENALVEAGILNPSNGKKADYTPEIDMDFDF